MARQNRTGRAYQMYFEEAMWEGLKAVADGNSRDVSVEVRKAVERYLLDPERVQAVAPPPSRPRGRPRKSPATDSSTEI